MKAQTKIGYIVDLKGSCEIESKSEVYFIIYKYNIMNQNIEKVYGLHQFTISPIKLQYKNH